MPRFCVIAHDRTEPGGAERRQASRRPHFERMKPFVESGAVLFAGSTLAEDGTMAASILIVDFPDRAALDTWLADEPYLRDRVWGRVEVSPMFVAVDGGGITPAWLELMRRAPPA
jgi:uncharacterized protein YciI